MTEENEVQTSTEGMAALPPGPSTPLVIWRPRTPKPPTITEMLNAVAAWFTVNIFACALTATVGAYLWNALADLHTLTTIDWRQAFAAVLLLRVLALVIRL